MYSNLSNQTKFRLNEINNIKDYLNAEIQEIQEVCRYISALIQTLIVLSATRAEISFFFTGMTGAAVGIASASFSLIFFWLQA